MCGDIDNFFYLQIRVAEKHAIQTDLFVYIRLHSRNIPSDNQETKLQMYTHTQIFSLEVKMVKILNAGCLHLGTQTWTPLTDDKKYFLHKLTESHPNGNLMLLGDNHCGDALYLYSSVESFKELHSSCVVILQAGAT